jgi:hypothetical protein
MSRADDFRVQPADSGVARCHTCEVDSNTEAIVDELIVVVLAPAVGYVARLAAKKAIATLKAKGVEIPPWVETVAPPFAGGIASVGGLGTIHHES